MHRNNESNMKLFCTNHSLMVSFDEGFLRISKMVDNLHDISILEHSENNKRIITFKQPT